MLPYKKHLYATFLVLILLMLPYIPMWLNSQRSLTPSFAAKQLEAPQNISPPKLTVLATTTLAADLVKNIGKSRLNVTTLMGVGIDPHLYKAREHDIRLLNQAAILVYHGLHLEAKLEEVFKHLKNNKTVITLSAGVPTNLLLTDEPSGIPDPHLWMDVRLWKNIAAYLTKELCYHDQPYCAFYQANYATYQQKLTQLDATVHATLATIPPSKRVLITAHDAFSYYGRAYQLTLKSLLGISTTSRFNLYDIQTLSSFIRTHQIPTIFAEQSVSARGLTALAHTLAAANYPIAISATLYSDSLGPADSPAGSYIAMIKHNTQAIAQALSLNNNDNDNNNASLSHHQPPPVKTAGF